ncbi:MAG: hypothetical protein IPK13_19230 [Deltaproteobacteria bacterium]|nr:hypothetical protein [Deltaproteobacteria bacterium]
MTFRSVVFVVGFVAASGWATRVSAEGTDDAEAPPPAPAKAAASSAGQNASPKVTTAPRPSAKDIEQQVIGAIARTAGAIDACNDAYIGEYPAAKGTVSLTAGVERPGTVSTASAETSLEGARNLRYCLERVARSWRFPPLTTGKEKEDLTITIPIAKGAKFKLKKPGEKEQESKPAAGKKPREGFIRFLPESFLPSWKPESEAGGTASDE